MSFGTPSSTALGWANFLYDYLGGNYPGLGDFVDDALKNALNDAQNGLSGAVVGGTIYFPPLSSSLSYPISGTHTITGSCALISTGSSDTAFAFTPSGDFPSTTPAFIIEGASVTLQGFTLAYPGQKNLSLAGDNVAAIQVLSTSGVLIEDVIILNAYGGVDCVASSMVCDGVEVFGTPSTSGNILPQLPPYGFCAEPGDATSLAGLTMVIRNSKVEPGKAASGVVGYLLVPPYPEMAIDHAAPKHVDDGFRVLSGASAVSGNSGILRVRNSSCENDTRSTVVQGGSVAQITHLNDDKGTTTPFGDGSLFAPPFTGVGLLAGNHYGSGSLYAIEFGVSLEDNTITGSEQPISALLGVIGCVASTSNIFLSMTASGSAVINTVATAQSGPSIAIGGLSVGPAAVVGGSLFAEGVFVSGGMALTPLLIEALATDDPNAIGGPVTLSDSPPSNPAGVVTPSHIPMSNPWSGVNDSGYDVVVYLEPTTGIHITGIAVGSNLTGLTTSGAVTYPIAVPAGQALELAFSTTPNSTNFNWTWIAN